MRRRLVALVAILFVAAVSSPVAAESEQDPASPEAPPPTTGESGPSGIRQVDVELEPVAFILRGFSITAAVMVQEWSFGVEVFRARIPEFLHNNDNFEAVIAGAELHAEWFFSDAPAGWFVGPEFGVTNLTVTHQPSNVSRDAIRFTTGIRGGYRWYPGIGNLYLSPQGGFSVTLNPQEFTIRGDTFGVGPVPVTPFATVGIGWSFGR